MNSDEALAALGYLRSAFGGWPIPEAEERAHLRLFRTCTRAELVQAIDELVRVSDRRPSPNDIAQRVRRVRRSARSAPAPPPDQETPWLATPEGKRAMNELLIATWGSRVTRS
jgi:hypothetical protein